MSLSARTLAGLLLATLLGSPALARAAPTSCADAYVSGQHLLREHHLGRAREQLLVCARDPCPRALQPECTQWLADAERAMPSVVVDVREAAGAPVRGARLSIDGVDRSELLDGTTRKIDPGQHVFRASADGHAAVDRTLLLREGEKSRLVVFELAPLPVTTAPEATPRAGERPSFVPAGVAGGVGVVALGVFAGFGVGGLSIRQSLAACRPECAPSRVAAGNTDWIVADASLGAAAVSLGLASYFFLHARAEQRRPSGVAGFTLIPEVDRSGGQLLLRSAF